MFTIPVSRKAVAVFVVSLITIGLRKIGVYETSAEVTALIVGAANLVAVGVVGEGTKYVNYFLERHHLPFHIKDEV